MGVAEAAGAVVAEAAGAELGAPVGAVVAAGVEQPARINTRPAAPNFDPNLIASSSCITARMPWRLSAYAACDKVTTRGTPMTPAGGVTCRSGHPVNPPARLAPGRDH